MRAIRFSGMPRRAYRLWALGVSAGVVAIVVVAMLFFSGRVDFRYVFVVVWVLGFVYSIGYEVNEILSGRWPPPSQYLRSVQSWLSRWRQ